MREREAARGEDKREPERKRMSAGMASPGKMGLMALAVLVPFAVLIGVATSGGATNGITSNAVDGVRSAGRRLQTANFSFATQLEMTICLAQDHGTDSATASGEQVRFLGACFLALFVRERMIMRVIFWRHPEFRFVEM